MFGQLRNKFLVLNLVIISVMMLLAFLSIYLITYNNIQAEIDRELHKVLEFYLMTGADKNQPQTLPPRDPPAPPPQRSFSFSLIVDKNWNIISFSSKFDIDEEFYETAKDLVFSLNSNTGKFKIQDTHWAFLIKPNLSGYQIVFLDITSQQGILTNLIYTFLLVALIMLVIIFFISKFFADRAIKPVKEAFEKQKQFIADASHELKTPLTIINTNADVLLENADDCIKNQSKWLCYIKSEADRMTRLINNLLYLAQVDNSDIKVIFSKFNLSKVIENTILAMEAVFFENNVLLEYEIEANVMILGNSEQIQQLAVALLENAVKYTKADGKVDISLKKRQNYAVLSVTNTGKGIPKEHIKRIFDRFYRIDESRTRKSGGYGLGLAIAKKIVENHGGKIYVKSIPGEKTTFYVNLPILKK